MSVDVKINPSLKRKLDGQRVKMALLSAMTETCIELNDRFSMNPPVPKKTGNLHRSNSYEVRNSGDIIEGLIRNSAKYWVYLNFGTSRIKPMHYVEHIVQTVQPSKKIAEKFHQKYKS